MLEFGERRPLFFDPERFLSTDRRQRLHVGHGNRDLASRVFERVVADAIEFVEPAGATAREEGSRRRGGQHGEKTYAREHQHHIGTNSQSLRAGG